jgi:hypothetical protein
LIEGTIDGEKYPIAVDESGDLQWTVSQIAQEKDEVWEDWSLGLGETKRETGQGYLFSRGFDASVRGALRLSPFYHNLNNTALTTGYGYFMEAVETTGSTLTYDAASSGTGEGVDSVTVEHTIASNNDRLLLVGISTDVVVDSVTYGGAAMTELGEASISAVVGSIFYYLLNPSTGANDIVASFGASGNMVVGATSWYGVDMDTPFGTAVGDTGTGTAVSVTVVTEAGEFVVDCVSANDGPTAAEGADQTERYDAVVTSKMRGAGSTQAGSDGGAMTYTLGTSKQWASLAVPIKPASTTSRSVMFISDTTKIFKYTYDSDTGLTLDATDTTASGVAGRPAKMNGNHYSPMGSGATAQKLTGTTWADVTGTWKADHLATFQEGVTPKLARVNSTTPNKVELNADTGDVGDNWSGGSSVGDTSTKITDLVEAQGQLFPCKEDNLYAYGIEAESFPVIPFLGRGKVDADNGKGSFSFGDEIIYMSKGNLWRYRIGGGALPVGLNTIRSWRRVLDFDLANSGRPSYGVSVGEYWYYLQNEGETSNLMQSRKRREGDPAGHELIQHSVLQIPLSKGLGVDSHNRLWIKGASAYEGFRDIRVIELANDGSLDTADRKGQSAGTHIIYFDERNPGRPQDQVQLRRYTVELEGDWDANIPLALWTFRDGETNQQVGSVITSSGVTTRNWTVGTNDQAYRFRPFLVVTTIGNYTPKNSQPDILRVIIGIRFPEIIRIVVNADPEALKGAGKHPIEVEQNLRRLQNKGTITFRRPDDYDDPAAGTDLVTDRTFEGEIEGVTDITYKTSEGYARGIELRVKRWITV